MRVDWGSYARLNLGIEHANVVVFQQESML
jgi:hypothetical protein